MAETLRVHEIYASIQGESTFAGLPCVFIRLTACNLRCSYCDTAYAFAGGTVLELPKVLDEVNRWARGFASTPRLAAPAIRLPLVELTGGEPLLQPAALPLMAALCDQGFTVLLETSGALDIAPVDPRVHRIMDLKCPSSGEVQRNRLSNLAHLRATDEIKFVIGTHEDLAWAKEIIARERLAERCPLLFSWVHPLSPEQQDPSLKRVPPGLVPISRQALVESIMNEALPVRFQAQLHKIVWPPEQRGV